MPIWGTYDRIQPAVDRVNKPAYDSNYEYIHTPSFYDDFSQPPSYSSSAAAAGKPSPPPAKPKPLPLPKPKKPTKDDESDDETGSYLHFSS